LISFLNTKSGELLPQSVDKEKKRYNAWLFFPKDIICVLRSGDDLYLARFKSNQGEANSDTKPPDLLPGLKFSDLLPSTDSERPKSTLAVNQVVISDAIFRALSPQQTPDVKYHINAKSAPGEAAARLIIWRDIWRTAHFTSPPNAQIFYSSSVFDGFSMRMLTTNDMAIIKPYLNPSAANLDANQWKYATAIAQTKFFGPIRAAESAGVLLENSKQFVVVTPIDDPKVSSFRIDSGIAWGGIDEPNSKAMLEAAVRWGSRAPSTNLGLSLAAASIGTTNKQIIAFANLGETARDFEGVTLRADKPPVIWNGDILARQKEKLESNYVNFKIPLIINDMDAQKRFLKLLGGPDEGWLGAWPVTPWALFNLE